MGVINPQPGEVYRSNDGKGPMSARVTSVAGDTVRMERWDEGQAKPKLFTMSIADLARSSCGWNRGRVQTAKPALAAVLDAIDAVNAVQQAGQDVFGQHYPGSTLQRTVAAALKSLRESVADAAPAAEGAKEDDNG